MALVDVRPQSEGGCWLWLGSLSGDGRGGGYGRFSFLGATVAAHRWIYALCHGRIKPSRQIDHLCETRNCVCPKHLEQVSGTENQRRKFRR